MNYRIGYLLLCFFVGMFLLIFYYMPLKGIGKDGYSKVSVEHDKLSREQDFKRFVKTIGDVQARLQALENAMDRISKDKTDSHQYETTTTMHNEVNRDMNSVFGEETDSHKYETMSNEGNGNMIGEIMRGENCFDSAEHGDDGEIVVKPCHKKGGNQSFEVKDGIIKHKNFCLSVAKPESGVKVVLKGCDQNDWIQEWQYHDLTFQAAETGYCMENEGEGAVKLEQCNPEIIYQQWYTQEG